MEWPQHSWNCACGGGAVAMHSIIQHQIDLTADDDSDGKFVQCVRLCGLVTVLPLKINDDAATVGDTN